MLNDLVGAPLAVQVIKSVYTKNNFEIMEPPYKKYFICQILTWMVMKGNNFGVGMKLGYFI